MATGVAGPAGLLFIILFFSVGQQFGTFNDVSIGLAAILTGTPACVLYSVHTAQSPLLREFALAAALAGALVFVAGSVVGLGGLWPWHEQDEGNEEGKGE